MVLIGRLLQYTGLIALPVAVLLELSNLLDRSFGLSEMLVMLVFGFCAFHVGRYLEGFALGQDG
jgi:hypothetical protein